MYDHTNQLLDYTEVSADLYRTSNTVMFAYLKTTHRPVVMTHKRIFAISKCQLAQIPITTTVQKANPAQAAVYLWPGDVARSWLIPSP